MSREQRRSHQWRETLSAAAALEEDKGNPEGIVPHPGEVYLNQRTANFAVEWLVLETAVDGSALVVPVDDYPLVGSRDVELLSPKMGRSSVARCGFDAWTPPAAWDADLYTAILDEEDLERVRARRRALDDQNVAPTPTEEVADGDPEYAHWVDGTLCRATETLARPADQAPRPGPVFQTLRRYGPRLAAAAVLVLALGLGFLTQRLSERLTAAQERISELGAYVGVHAKRTASETRQRRTAEGEARRLANLLIETEAAREAMIRRLEDVRSELSQALDMGVTINVVELLFGQRARFTRSGRRGEIVIIKRREDRRLFLKVEIVDPEPYSTYRVHLIPRRSGVGKPLTIKNLYRRDAWLRFGLPSAEIETGEYDVLIEGLGLEEPTELEERYRLTVESEGFEPRIGPNSGATGRLGPLILRLSS